MATHGWRTGRTLREQLLQESSGFNYFQLFHLLEREKSRLPVEKFDAVSGGDQPRQHWKVHADLDAAFPVAEISQIDPPAGNGPQALVARTSNYCIAGHLGPLPDAYTEWMRDQKYYGRTAMADFLDLFNHRINVLRYESRSRSYLPLDTRAPEDNLLAPGLAAAMGMLGEGLFEQLPLSKRSLMSLSGLLANQRVSAHVIQRVVSKAFGFKTRVADLIGAWSHIAEDQLWALDGTDTGRLGEMSLLGQHYMDMQARIRVETAPLELSTYLALLPDMEFSSSSLRAQVRSLDEVRLREFDNAPITYAIAGDAPVADAESLRVSPGNLVLERNAEMARERVFSPSHASVDTPVSGSADSRQSVRLRIDRWAGYLHKPFAALLRYLTNAQVDIEVVLRLDAASLPPEGIPLESPDNPAEARLRLGQSFWLGARPTDFDSDQPGAAASFLLQAFPNNSQPEAPL